MQSAMYAYDMTILSVVSASACLSVTLMYFFEVPKHIIKMFSLFSTAPF